MWSAPAPRSLADAARLTSMTKPVVAVRPPDTPSAQLLSESGVILVDAVSELADQAAMMSSQPVPLGSRVAIVSNSASLARLTEAACRRFDLTPTVPAGTVGQVPSASILIDNLDQVSEVFGLTVAMSRTGTVADYERVIRGHRRGRGHRRRDPGPRPDRGTSRWWSWNGSPTASTDPSTSPSPWSACTIAAGWRSSALPFFTFPEEAARALSRSAAYGRWRSSGVDAVAADRSDHPLAQIDSVLGPARSRRLGLVSDETPELLAELGLPIAPFASGTDLDELRHAAQVIGYPVVLKIDGRSNAPRRLRRYRHRPPRW